MAMVITQIMLLSTLTIYKQTITQPSKSSATYVDSNINPPHQVVLGLGPMDAGHGVIGVQPEQLAEVLCGRPPQPGGGGGGVRVCGKVHRHSYPCLNLCMACLRRASLLEGSSLVTMA